MIKYSFLMSLVLILFYSIISNCYPCDIAIKITGSIEDRKSFISNDNNYIVSGNISIEKEGGWFDAFIMKIQKDCKILWQKTYRSKYDDRFWDIIETDDGGFMAVGQIGIPHKNDNYKFGISHGWILKVDANGNIMWQKIFQEVYIFWSIFKNDQNSYSVIGQVPSLNIGEGGTLIIKMDNDGNIIWQKIIKMERGGFHLGASTEDRGFILLGGIDKSAQGDLLKLYVLVAKFNLEGEMEWQKSYGINGMWNAFRFIEQSLDKGFLIGSWNDPDLENDIPSKLWILKINQNGDIEWQKLYSGIEDGGVNNAWLNKDGSYIISGLMNRFKKPKAKPWLLKIDDKSKLSWIKSYDIEFLNLISISKMKDNLYLLFADSLSTDKKESFYIFTTIDNNGIIEFPEAKLTDIILKEENSNCKVENISAGIEKYSLNEISYKINSRDFNAEKIKFDSSAFSKKNK